MAKKTKKRYKKPSAKLDKRAGDTIDDSWSEEDMDAISKKIHADDPKRLFSDGIAKRINKMSPEEKKDFNYSAYTTLSFRGDYTVALTVDKKYRGLAIELRRQLIKDFDCRTAAEKILVDTVINAYIRTLRSAEVFNGCINLTNKEGIWKETTDLMALLSKEQDRANRHLLTAYQSLLQLKRPALNVKISAKHAFIAQAQQFNSDKDSHHE